MSILLSKVVRAAILFYLHFTVPKVSVNCRNIKIMNYNGGNASLIPVYFMWIMINNYDITDGEIHADIDVEITNIDMTVLILDTLSACFAYYC